MKASYSDTRRELARTRGMQHGKPLLQSRVWEKRCNDTCYSPNSNRVRKPTPRSGTCSIVSVNHLWSDVKGPEVLP
eukprot:NODE_21069_length_770_cov_3.597201.p2 GENE.NODE_21069_length_770_cov_3.597201~~NODE_21069_length_770_cov_3.597201.p2  ORF type:complete len:76 (+),score=1.67 NODE_21069_length_770_cov_3.597201:517-744(+)